MCVCVLNCSVMSDSLWPYGLQPTRLPVHGDSPGENTGMACHVLLQGIYPTRGGTKVRRIEPRSPTLQVNSLLSEPRGKPKNGSGQPIPSPGRLFWPRNQTRVSCIAGRFFTSWATRGALRDITKHAIVTQLLQGTSEIQIPFSLNLCSWPLWVNQEYLMMWKLSLLYC